MSTISLLKSSFDTINVLTRSHTSGQTSVDDNVDNDFDSNIKVVEANEPQVHSDLTVPLSTLDLLKEQYMINPVNLS